MSNINDSDVRYYPNCDRAKTLLSSYAGVHPSCLTIFDGSDRALRDIFQVFAQPGNDVLTVDPAFPMYRVYAAMFGLNYVAIAYDTPYAPIERLVSAINDNTGIVVLSNPCSPVGDTLSPHNIVALLTACNRHNALLLIDEAYIEFSRTKSNMSNAVTYDNVIVIRTLSKAAGSAGVRIGYAICTEDNTRLLQQVSSMNEVSAFAVAWLDTLMKFDKDVVEYIRQVVDNRWELKTLCNKLSLNFLPSETNFMHIQGLELGNEFVTKRCVFPWSNDIYTRFSIPANPHSHTAIIEKITQLADHRN
jgi:histidinol-phosphate aminotransferase